MTQRASPGALWWPRREGSGTGKKTQEGGNRYLIMTDTYCCMAETNTIWESNFPPIKIFKGYCINNWKKFPLLSDTF